MSTSSTGIVFDPIFLKHDQHGHPESAKRLESVFTGLKAKGLLEKITQIKSRPAMIDEIKACHTNEYIKYVKEFCEKGGGYLDPDTYSNNYSCIAAATAVGSSIDLVKSVIEGKIKNGTGAVDPRQRYPLEFSAVTLCMLIMPSISWLHYFNLAALSVILISAYCFTVYSTPGLIIIVVVLLSYVLIAFHPDYPAMANYYGQGILVKIVAAFPFIGTFIMLIIHLLLVNDKKYRSPKIY